jgi:hypothetical protein
LLISLAATAFYCAGQVPPSGGPPDRTPPAILETYPKSGALNFNGKQLSFSFNKYINRRTLEESFFISPPIRDLSFEWDGKSVSVSFTDTLRNNTTYIATLGSDLTDTRGNKLARSFALPFSTGEKLDSASISGIVADEKPEGVMIFGYILNDIDPDSLNPSKTKPDYVTQTGKDGSFVLPYLRYGKYRIFAFRDEYKNLLYDIGVDQMGVLNNDILLSDSTAKITGIQFKLALEDTAQPFLSSARAIDDSHILLRLSEPIDWRSATTETIQIEDTLSRTQLAVREIGFVDEFNKEAQVVTDRQDIARAFRIRLNGWKDVSGNFMKAPLNIGEFVSAISIDTTKPVIELKDVRSRNVNFPIDDSIKITFSEPIIREIFERGFHIEDSSKKVVDGKFIWQHATKMTFIPSNILVPGMKYTLVCMLDSVIDYSGNIQKDSTVQLKFQTIEERSLSEMKGVVSDESKTDSGKIYIYAFNLTKKEIKPKVVFIKKPGTFSFQNLMEGKYSITSFRDADANGLFTYGKIFPFKSAERFVNNSDTLKVRARWPLEGIQIRFK